MPARVLTEAEKDEGRWVRNKASAVVKGFVYHLCNEMQTPKKAGGRMPVDTGTLRGSFMVGVGWGGEGKLFTGVDAHVKALKTIRIGDTIRFSWEAHYANIQEYGSKLGHKPNFFMHAALARGYEHLNKAIAEVNEGGTRWWN